MRSSDSLLAAVLTGLALGVGNQQQAPVPPSPPDSAGALAPAAAPTGKLSLPPGALRRFGGDRFRITGWPLASTLSRDGTRLAVLSSAQGRNQVVLSVLDAVTGRPVCRAAVESIGFFATPSLAFSPDGKYVAAAVTSEVGVVWAAATGELVMKVPPSKFGWSLCQFTPDGLLAFTEDQQTDLYEVPSGKKVKTWPVGRIAELSSDARTFVRCDKEFESITIGDPVTGVEAGILPIKTACNGADNGLAFSPDGKLLAAIHERKTLQVWDVVGRKKLSECSIQDGLIAANDPHYLVSFSPDGQTIVLETKRGQIERWETGSLQRLPMLHVPWAMYTRGVHWSKDRRTILAVADTGLVHRWDAKTSKRLADEGYSSRVRFALTPAGDRLIVADHAGRIDLWDVATGRVIRSLASGRDMGGALLCLALSPDGAQLAVGEGGGGLRLYRTRDGADTALIQEDREITAWFRFLEWAADGRTLFAGDGKTIRRLSGSDGKPVWQRSAEAMPWGITADGRRLLTTRKDSLLWLDAATGTDAATVHIGMTAQQAERDRALWAVALAPDGKQIALAVGRSSIAVCDAAARERRRFLATDRKAFLPGLAPLVQQQMPDQRHYRIAALAFAPDGKWIVSGGEDFAVRVWEAATGKLIARFDGQDSIVQQLAVAPDGRSVFSASNDGYVCQWDLTPKPAARLARLDELWTATADPDPALAVPAAWTLITRSEEMRAFVAGKLPPASAPATGEQIAKWLADLDAPAFADREAATKALAALGRVVEPHLRRTIQTTTSLEVRRRAEGLIARFENTYTAEELRALRLVQACELSHSSAGRTLLQRWAGGAAGAVLTEDANAALARLDRRDK